MRKVLLGLVGLFLLLATGEARAQQVVKPCLPVTTSASGVAVTSCTDGHLTSSNLSGTIASTNTFQSVQVLSKTRNGCTVQNPSTNSNTQFVFFGPLASASTPHAFTLAPGQAIACSVGGLGTAVDQVSITGTSGDGFVALFQ